MSGMRSRSRLAAACAAALLTSLAPAVAHADPDPADGVRFITALDSKLATHHWFQQTYQGTDVIGGYLVVHVDKATNVATVDNGRKPVGDHVPGELPPLSLPAPQPRADNGSYVSGTAKVFAPNPVVSEQNQTLTDQNDANEAVPNSAYRPVTVRYLDGTGFLVGKYAQVTTAGPSRPARETTLNYDYVRLGRWFDQTMAYHWVTESQRYVVEDLGFAYVNNSRQKIRWDASEKDESWYDHRTDEINMGRGGVDATEDADVIWHELGHAMIRSQVITQTPAGLEGEMRAISEGFGDWWAMAMSSSVQDNNSTVTPLACIGDWDSTSYTTEVPHCLRRTDTDLTYFDYVGGDNTQHRDGQIWSRALNDIFGALGRDRSATIVLEAQFTFLPGSSFQTAARKTVSTARRLYGDDAADVVSTAFQNRGINA